MPQRFHAAAGIRERFVSMLEPSDLESDGSVARWSQSKLCFVILEEPRRTNSGRDFPGCGRTLGRKSVTQVHIRDMIPTDTIL
jgi:hypothetical protein